MRRYTVQRDARKPIPNSNTRQNVLPSKKCPNRWSKVQVAWDSWVPKDIRKAVYLQLYMSISAFRQSASRESRAKRPKSQTSAGKVMASLFLGSSLFINCLEKGRTINNKYNIAFKRGNQEKSSLSSRQYTLSEVDWHHGMTMRSEHRNETQNIPLI